MTRFRIEDAESEVSEEVVNKRDHSAFRGVSLYEVWHGALSTGASFQLQSNIMVYHTEQISNGPRPMFWNMQKCAMDGNVNVFIT